MSNIITVREGGFVYLSDFKDLLDVGKVVSYNIKPHKDGTISIKFYDKKGKLVKPNAK